MRPPRALGLENSKFRWRTRLEAVGAGGWGPSMRAVHGQAPVTQPLTGELHQAEEAHSKELGVEELALQPRQGRGGRGGMMHRALEAGRRGCWCAA